MKKLPEPLENRYQAIELLHQGAAVTTYAARQTESPQAIVIKMLDLKKIQAWKALELFEREVAVLQGLEHAAIPEYIDAFQAEYAGQDYYCLLQERVSGQTLQQIIDAQIRFSEIEIVALASQLLEVLIYLHGLNPPIIHRDIKPDNLIWQAGKLALLDFGGVLKNLGPAQSTVVGTYGYMAPEQFQGKASVRSDLYSVGMTLVHALSHVHPATMESQGLAVEIAPYLDCSEALLYWLQRLTALAPEDRFQNAAEALLYWLQRLTALAPEDRFQNAAEALRALSDPETLFILPAAETHMLTKEASVNALSRRSASLPAEIRQHYQIERSSQGTVIQTKGRNAFSVRQGLKIDAFAILPGLAMFGFLKMAGVATFSALLPSLIFLPIAAFLLLSILYANTEIEINSSEVIYKKNVAGWIRSTHEYDLSDSRFIAFAVGKSASKKALPESVGAIKLVSDTEGDERVIDLGLSLAAYQELAALLNQEIAQFSDGFHSERDLLL